MSRLINPCKRRAIYLALGPCLFLLALLSIPSGSFDFNSRVAIGTVLWMGSWWITLPVSVGITAMLPIVLNAVFGIIPMSSVMSKYASEIVILLLGANIITVAWEQSGLDRRCSLKALCLIGPSLKYQIIVWFVISAALSALLANSVVCAILTPVAYSMLKYVGEGDLSLSKCAPIILASIAWGAGIGGLGSPLGGAMNLVAVDYFESITGREFMYVNWIVRLLPIMILLIIVNLVYLLLIRPKKASLNGSKAYFQELYGSLSKISRDEIVGGILFFAAVALSFLRPLYIDWLPHMKPAYLFLLCGILTFVIPKKDRSGPLLTWKIAEKGIIWELLFLFAGGLALGAFVSETNAAGSIALLLQRANLGDGFLTILLFTAFTVLLAEISSNTAAAAISLPIIISTTSFLGLNPIPYIYICAAAFNCGYVLPTSIRSIPVGYGLDPKYLFKNGLVLTISSIIVISIAGYLMIRLFPDFMCFA